MAESGLVGQRTAHILGCVCKRKPLLSSSFKALSYLPNWEASYNVWTVLTVPVPIPTQGVGNGHCPLLLSGFCVL